MENQKGNLSYNVKIQRIIPEGNIKATATANINNTFAIRGIKVLDGSKGLFVSMPSYKAGNGEYKDICFPCTSQSRKEFDKAVIGAYEQALKLQQVKEQKQEMPTGQKPSTNSEMSM